MQHSRPKVLAPVRALATYSMTHVLHVLSCRQETPRIFKQLSFVHASCSRSKALSSKPLDSSQPHDTAAKHPSKTALARAMQLQSASKSAGLHTTT